MFKIMLDPGHYNGQNPYYGEWGKKGITEAGQMWKLANFIKEYMLANFVNVQVDFTKGSQAIEVSLENRGLKAKGYNLFWSLHTNAWTVETRGTQMYYAAGDHDGSSRKLAVYMADLIGDEVFGHADSISRAVLRLYPNTSNVSYYGVLRAAEQTGVGEAIMSELGFHTNDQDLKIIATDQGLRLVAKVTCEGWGDWYKLQRKTAGSGGAPNDSGGSGAGSPPANTFVQYVVKKDESPWSIAAAMLGDGMRYKEILSINGLKEPYMIYTGQILLLPTDAKVTTPAPKPVPQPKQRLVNLSKGTPIFRDPPSSQIDMSGVYTLVEEEKGAGKLKSGVGYIPLSAVED